MKKIYNLLPLFLCVAFMVKCQSKSDMHNDYRWKYFSTVQGDLELPNKGKQQTATAVFDVDKDGVNDFLITERTQAPAVVWYRRVSNGWKRYVVESEALHIEAGSAVCDIDRDNDLDVVFGGDSWSNKVWWWENPYPDYDPKVPWKRREVKSSGATKHHDQIFADFDGDGCAELVFWNQNAHKLFITEPWELHTIYVYDVTDEPPQRGIYPSWKGRNEHEGLTASDIDGDGVLDIVGGGRWFKHLGGKVFQSQIIDENFVFTQLIKGGHPEVVMVPGDGQAPMCMYEWENHTWRAITLIDKVRDGHSLALVDFNQDGNLDIFNAEMRLGENPDAKTRILLGDGKGHFTEKIMRFRYPWKTLQLANAEAGYLVECLE